jgi:hypothetical protein
MDTRATFLARSRDIDGRSSEDIASMSDDRRRYRAREQAGEKWELNKDGR